jgi:glyoxylase-like metal-dependent hydrolase (beta-lactamase superfamily II)
LPVFAHPLTAQAQRGKVSVSKEVHDGDVLDLGPAPHGRGRWHLQAVHTPGHAPGHLAFYEPSYQLLFVGDMVSTISSIIVAPPDGDLIVYLASLRLLQRYPARLLLPAHGPVSARPAVVLDEALAHRAKREEQLIGALGAGSGPRSVADLGLELYRGLPANLLRLAELQIQAGLLKLEREGRARRVGEGWRPAP